MGEGARAVPPGQLDRLVERLAGLEVCVEGSAVEPLALATASGWTRRSSVVVLTGGGLEGRGEDVTYAGPDHDDLQAGRIDLAGLVGRRPLGELWAAIGDLDAFLADPAEPKARRYRRWALDSAALDLALGQAGVDLASFLEREPEPLTFAASLSFDGVLAGPGFERLELLRERVPGLRFKLDWATGWGPEALARLAELELVDVVDLKGHYRGDFRGPDPDGDAYRAVAEALPAAWLEDPWLGGPMSGPWGGRTWDALEPFIERVTWDAPFGGLADLDALPAEPRAVNIKPSRFGSFAELARVLERCRTRGIGAYAGGQFELGVGRRQLQLLAALFFPDGPNDCAPSDYNAAELASELPATPLTADASAFGVGG